MIRKFSGGDRVVILSKNHWGPLESSNVYSRRDANGNKRKYWYVLYYENKDVVIVNNKYNGLDGDYFLESDLEFYKYPDVMDKFGSEEFNL